MWATQQSKFMLQMLVWTHLFWPTLAKRLTFMLSTKKVMLSMTGTFQTPTLSGVIHPGLEWKRYLAQSRPARMNGQGQARTSGGEVALGHPESFVIDQRFEPGSNSRTTAPSHLSLYGFGIFVLMYLASLSLSPHHW